MRTTLMIATTLAILFCMNYLIYSAEHAKQYPALEENSAHAPYLISRKSEIWRAK